ncbi:hypothetical protein DSO57_1018743 [Entomophthora muscae]|uniref:Uncharacterized protein n=1 Tax=Entomophthora muscae TaxID=34485 RepID=A0ACC2RVE5_9FUNG|nr:hypothetical protein DSO57_1018743 [Entomophthora muscae]
MVISLFPKHLVLPTLKKTEDVSANVRFSISENGKQHNIVSKCRQIQYSFTPGDKMLLCDTRNRKVTLFTRNQGPAFFYEVKLDGYTCHYSDIIITSSALEYTDANGIPRIFEWTEEAGGLVLRSTLPSKPNIDYATVRAPSLLSFGTLANFDILSGLIPADYALYIAFLMAKNFSPK